MSHMFVQKPGSSLTIATTVETPDDLLAGLVDLWLAAIRKFAPPAMVANTIDKLDDSGKLVALMHFIAMQSTDGDVDKIGKLIQQTMQTAVGGIEKLVDGDLPDAQGGVFVLKPGDAAALREALDAAKKASSLTVSFKGFELPVEVAEGVLGTMAEIESRVAGGESIEDIANDLDGRHSPFPELTKH